MNPRKAAAILAAFALFFLSIQAIRAGGTVPDALADRLDRPTRALGLGWLGAILALAGSPIAALAVALHGTGAIGPSSLFAAIAGSRLGAEAIVLVTGAMALVRGRRAPERREADRRGIEVGFLAFLVAFTVYLPATLVGFVLTAAWTPEAGVGGLAGVAGFTAVTTGPIVERLVALAGPGWTVLLGVIGLWTAFRLFEKNLPTPNRAGPAARAARRMLLHPSLTFLLGAAVTFAVTTVSLSMTLLIPLHMRGYVTRGQMAAYMLGAGVTTLVDTWFVAVVAGDPVAQGVVLVLAGLVLLLSLACLVFFPAVMAFWNRALTAITASPMRMAVAAASLVVVPGVLAFV